MVIAGAGLAGQPEYDGTFVVTAVTANTFTYAPSGTPSSSATGGAMTVNKPLDVNYYRYYTSNTLPGYTGGLKSVFGPQAYARLTAAVPDAMAASDATVAPYADTYYEYDDLRRVALKRASGEGCSSCSGGQGTYTYAYADGAGADRRQRLEPPHHRDAARRQPQRHLLQ